MIKKTIEYSDFNDEKVTQDFYFHLSPSELVELELSHQGGLSESLKRMILTNDGEVIMADFKKIILKAYGVRSIDGRRFVKNAENLEEFVSSGAYDALFMSLVTDTDAMVEFINGLAPANLSEQAAKWSGIDPEKTPLVVVETNDKEALEKAAEKISAPETITRAKILEMPAEELQGLWERVKKGEVVIQG